MDLHFGGIRGGIVSRVEGEDGLAAVGGEVQRRRRQVAAHAAGAHLDLAAVFIHRRPDPPRRLHEGIQFAAAVGAAHRREIIEVFGADGGDAVAFHEVLVGAGVDPVAGGTGHRRPGRGEIGAVGFAGVQVRRHPAEARRREALLRPVDRARGVDRVGAHVIGLVGDQAREIVGERARAAAGRHVLAVGHGRVRARAPNHAAFGYQGRALVGHRAAAVGAAGGDAGNVGGGHLRQVGIHPAPQRAGGLEIAHAAAAGIGRRDPVVVLGARRGRDVVEARGVGRGDVHEGGRRGVVRDVAPDAEARLARAVRPRQGHPVAVGVVAGRQAGDFRQLAVARVRRAPIAGARARGRDRHDPVMVLLARHRRGVGGGTAEHAQVRRPGRIGIHVAVDPVRRRPVRARPGDFHVVGRRAVRGRRIRRRHDPAEAGVRFAPRAGAQRVGGRHPVIILNARRRRGVVVGRVVRRVRADGRRAAEGIEGVPPDHEARLVGGHVDPADFHQRRAAAVRSRHRRRHVRRAAAGRHAVGRRRAADAAAVALRPEAVIVGHRFQQAGHGYAGAGHRPVLVAGHVGARAPAGLPALDHQPVHARADAAAGAQRLPADPRVGEAQMRRVGQRRLDRQAGTRRRGRSHHGPVHAVVRRNRNRDDVVGGGGAAVAARPEIHRQVGEADGRERRRRDDGRRLDQRHVGRTRQIVARPVVRDGPRRRRRVAGQHHPGAAAAARGEVRGFAHVDEVTGRAGHRVPGRGEIGIVRRAGPDGRGGARRGGGGVVDAAVGPERLANVVGKRAVVVERAGIQARMVVAGAGAVVDQRAARERVARRRRNARRGLERAGQVVDDHHVVARRVGRERQVDLVHARRRRRKLVRRLHRAAPRRHRPRRRIAALAIRRFRAHPEVVRGFLGQPRHRRARAGGHQPVLVARHEAAAAAAARREVVEVDPPGGAVVREPAVDAEIRRGVVHRVRQRAAVVGRLRAIGEPGRVVQRELAAGVARHAQIQAVVQRARAEVPRRAEIAHLRIADARLAPQLDVVRAAIHADLQVVALEVVGGDVPRERRRRHQHHAEVVARRRIKGRTPQRERPLADFRGRRRQAGIGVGAVHAQERAVRRGAAARQSRVRDDQVGGGVARPRRIRAEVAVREVVGQPAAGEVAAGADVDPVAGGAGNGGPGRGEVGEVRGAGPGRAGGRGAGRRLIAAQRRPAEVVVHVGPAAVVLEDRHVVRRPRRQAGEREVRRRPVVADLVAVGLVRRAREVRVHARRRRAVRRRPARRRACAHHHDAVRAVAVRPADPHLVQAHVREQQGRGMRGRLRRGDRLRAARGRRTGLGRRRERQIARRHRAHADRIARRRSRRDVRRDEDVARGVLGDPLGQRGQRMRARSQIGRDRAQQRVAARFQRGVGRIPHLEVVQVRGGARRGEAHARQRRGGIGRRQLELVQDMVVRARRHGSRRHLRAVVRQRDVGRPRHRRHVRRRRVVARATPRAFRAHPEVVRRVGRQAGHQLARSRRHLEVLVAGHEGGLGDGAGIRVKGDVIDIVARGRSRRLDDPDPHVAGHIDVGGGE